MLRGASVAKKEAALQMTLNREKHVPLYPLSTSSFYEVGLGKLRCILLYPDQLIV